MKLICSTKDRLLVTTGLFLSNLHPEVLAWGLFSLNTLDQSVFGLDELHTPDPDNQVWTDWTIVLDAKLPDEEFYHWKQWKCCKEPELRVPRMILESVSSSRKRYADQN